MRSCGFSLTCLLLLEHIVLDLAKMCCTNKVWLNESNEGHYRLISLIQTVVSRLNTMYHLNEDEKRSGYKLLLHTLKYVDWQGSELTTGCSKLESHISGRTEQTYTVALLQNWIPPQAVTLFFTQISQHEKIHILSAVTCRTKVNFDTALSQENQMQVHVHNRKNIWQQCGEIA